jgi:hypothetical protein
MSVRGPDSSLPKHLAALVATGEVRPGDGSRFLPEPVKARKRGKTAADYVAEGRR